MNNYQAVILFCGIDAIALLILLRFTYRSFVHQIQFSRDYADRANSRCQFDIDMMKERMAKMDAAYSTKIAELTAKIDELNAQGQEVERSVSRAFMRSDSDAKTIAGLTRALQAFAPRADRR